jgi:hypothetical protein
MGRREFIVDKRGYALMGDERDIMTSSRHYQEIIDWCRDNGIDAVANSCGMSALAFGVVLWKVVDEEQRLVFLLRWA